MALTNEDLVHIQNMINQAKFGLPNTIQLNASNPTINDFPLIEELLDTDLFIGEHLDTGDNFKTTTSLIKVTIKKYLLSARIGELYININNQYKDALGFNDGHLAYLLLNGQIINKADYTELADKWGITTDTFALPDFSQNGGTTLKHVSDSRALGSFEADAVKNHAHDLNIQITAKAHNHYTATEYQYLTALDRCGNPDGGGDTNCSRTNYWRNVQTVNTTGGREYTDNSTVVLNPYTGNTASTGETKNIMQNLGVQCYVVAKVANV